MNSKTTIINIYNFIRMSHSEPSIFIQDDFDTIKNQLIFAKQSGFSGTYALKYDALTEPKYQELLLEYLDENDEISAWWEITEELCKKADVPFRDNSNLEEYDDRVNSAYCLGYDTDERKKLIDAYMAVFYDIFHKYPQTIGSWILDVTTLDYAAKKYGIIGAAICRDQISIDGFTLWGGYPNGIYYPSLKNEYIPAQTINNQLSIPVFRLLGPDPIYNFEANVRDSVQGVTSLEPSCLTGRDKNWISWIFTRLTDEDSLGIGYAQVGQENNFLWENIKPGYEPQLSILKEMTKEKDIRIETMASTAKWFKEQYIKTPPSTFQASFDWNKEENLSAMWYASAGYRIGFLGEDSHLRIRDLFLFDENYPSRYLNAPMNGVESIFDALPILSPQLWNKTEKNRPYIRLFDTKNNELIGKCTYKAKSESMATATLKDDSENILAEFIMNIEKLTLKSKYKLHFDYLPVFSIENNSILLEHNGYKYSFTVICGNIIRIDENSLEILPKDNTIEIMFNPNAAGTFSADDLVPTPKLILGKSRPIPPQAPIATPFDSVFEFGTTQQIKLFTETNGEIRYTFDGTEPTKASDCYTSPITINKDTVIKAKVFLSNGSVSDIATYHYFFGLKDIKLSGSTKLDRRSVFCGNGISDLLQVTRGDLDYQSGIWRASLENIDVTAEMKQPTLISTVSLGFLSHHRSGIVYPEFVELFVGTDKNNLSLLDTVKLPCKPCDREIEKQDIKFNINKEIGALRIVAHRYSKMPNWCCYRGATNVFTMVDNIIIVPQK